jgi:hypothetical protein
MSLDQGPYQLLSSTRFDPFLTTVNWNNDHDGPSSFFLLPYHFDRLASAAKTHKWNQATSVFSYDYLKSACSDAISEQQYDSSSAFRVNLLYSWFQSSKLYHYFLCIYRFELHFHKMAKSSCLQLLWRQVSRPIRLHYQLTNLRPLIMTARLV